jgi:hypothetical protein
MCGLIAAFNRTCFAWHNTRIALISIPLVYALVLAISAQGGFPTSISHNSWRPYLADKPIGEDGYYMLTVAWNLAVTGVHGFTYNGNIETTGVQPLAVIVYAGIAKLIALFGLDKDSFVRSVIFFQGLLHTIWALSIGQLCNMVRLRLRPTHLHLGTLDFAALPALAYPAFRLFTYGLETGLYLLLFTLFLQYILRNKDRLEERPLLLGVFVGVVGLARIDFVLIIGLVLMGALIAGKVRVAKMLPAGLIAAIVLCPWFYYCYSVTGVALPSSAGAQAGMLDANNTSVRIASGFSALLDQFVPWIAASSRVEMTMIGCMVFLAGLAYVFVNKRFSDLIKPLTLWPIGITAIALVVVAGIYLITISAAHFYSRYFILISVISYVCVSCALQTQKEVVTLALICLCLFSFQSYLAFHSGRVGNTHALAAGAIASKFPQPTQVGMFQSGVTGFYNQNVFNLDGKLDHRALEKLRNGRMLDYVNERKIGAVCDWPSYIDASFKERSGFVEADAKLTPFHVCYVRIS